MNPDDQNNQSPNNPVIDITPPSTNPVDLTTPTVSEPSTLSTSLPTSSPSTIEPETLLPTDTLPPADSEVIPAPSSDLLSPPNLSDSNDSLPPLTPPSTDITPSSTLKTTSQSPTTDSAFDTAFSTDFGASSDSVSTPETTPDQGPFPQNFTPDSSELVPPPAPPVVENPIVMPPQTPPPVQDIPSMISPEIVSKTQSTLPPVESNVSPIVEPAPTNHSKSNPLMVVLFIILSIVLGIGIGLAVQYFYPTAESTSLESQAVPTTEVQNPTPTIEPEYNPSIDDLSTPSIGDETETSTVEGDIINSNDVLTQ